MFLVKGEMMAPKNIFWWSVLWQHPRLPRPFRLDILPHFAIIPSEIRSPIPLPGGKVWCGDFEPHFLYAEEWGFVFRGAYREAKEGKRGLWREETYYLL